MKLAMLFVFCYTILALPALADSRIKIATVPALYQPPESMYKQPLTMAGYYFEADPRAGTAHVIVDYTYRALNPFVYDSGPGFTKAEILGLSWNDATRSVVYAANGRQAVCAVAQPGKKLEHRRLHRHGYRG